MVEQFAESLFPRLKGTRWSITSPTAEDYNCVAWAAGDPQHWWWPVGPDGRNWWPSGAPSSETVSAFIKTFEMIGYSTCDGDQVEAGIEKVALFAHSEISPRHAARQLSSGRWTSKLGELEDIEHELRALEGTEYGRVVAVMRRPIVPNKQKESV